MAMHVSPHDAVLNAIAHWSDIKRLATFALERHGYGDSDGGFGVTYPTDLDGYEREVLKVSIPEGSLQVYGFWGPPDGYEILVEESFYLLRLSKCLSEKGHQDLAGLVDDLASRI